MTACEESNAHFTRVMHLRFGYFTGDEGIRSGFNRGFEMALRAAAAPCDIFKRAVGDIDQRHRSIERFFNMRGQVYGAGKARRTDAAPYKSQRLLAKAPGWAGVRHQTQPQAELRVVAQFRVRIKRQVISKQIDIGAQQQAQTLPHPARHTAALPAPEQAVVHKNGISLGMDRRFDQCLTGRHARDDFVHLGATFYLQAVRTEVFEALWCEQQVEGVQEFMASGAHALIVALPACIALQHRNAAGTSWRMRAAPAAQSDHIKSFICSL